MLCPAAALCPKTWSCSSCGGQGSTECLAQDSEEGSEQTGVQLWRHAALQDETGRGEDMQVGTWVHGGTRVAHLAMHGDICMRTPTCSSNLLMRCTRPQPASTLPTPSRRSTIGELSGAALPSAASLVARDGAAGVDAATAAACWSVLRSPARPRLAAGKPGSLPCPACCCSPHAALAPVVPAATAGAASGSRRRLEPAAGCCSCRKRTRSWLRSITSTSPSSYSILCFLLGTAAAAGEAHYSSGWRAFRCRAGLDRLQRAPRPCSTACNPAFPLVTDFPSNDSKHHAVGRTAATTEQHRTKHTAAPTCRCAR